MTMKIYLIYKHDDCLGREGNQNLVIINEATSKQIAHGEIQICAVNYYIPIVQVHCILTIHPYFQFMQLFFHHLFSLLNVLFCIDMLEMNIDYA